MHTVLTLTTQSSERCTWKSPLTSLVERHEQQTSAANKCSKQQHKSHDRQVHLSTRGPDDEMEGNQMNRIASTMRVLGLSGVLMVGMSTPGVASTSRPAVAQTASSSAAAPKPVSIQAPGDTQVTKKLTREEQLGMKALDLVSFRWQEALPGWRIRFLPQRKGYLAITFREQRRIDVYVRIDRPVAGVAHDVAHELGHAIDVTYLNDERRAAVLDIRGLSPATNWWACNACTDLQTGAGDFAESFALIAAPRYKFYSELGTEPTPQMVRAISSVIADALGTV